MSYFRRILAGIAVSFATTAAVLADYPSAPITLVVPYAPGGASDIIGRLYAHHLEEILGERIIVENVGGAGGSIGAQRVARANADGYTLLVGAGSEMLIFQHLHNPAPYNTLTDFNPIAMLGVGPMVLLGQQDLPADSLAEVIKLAKPGGASEMSYGSAGIGTFMHLVGEAINVNANVSIDHVPYKGAGPLLTDLAGGHVDLGVSSLAAALPFIRSGQVKAFGLSSSERSELAPDIQTLGAHPDLEGFELEMWIGLFAPSGTPQEVLAKLRAATEQIASSEKFKERLADQALVPRPELNGEDFLNFLSVQDKKYGEIITKANITPN